MESLRLQFYIYSQENKFNRIHIIIIYIDFCYKDYFAPNVCISLFEITKEADYFKRVLLLSYLLLERYISHKYANSHTHDN